MKYLYGLILAVGMIFLPLSVKAEEVVTTEVPTEEVTESEDPSENEVTESEGEKSEDPTESEETTIEDIESQLEALIDKLENSGYLDETDFGKWFEKNIGVALSVVLSSVAGFLAAILLGLKEVKQIKSVFNSSDSISKKTEKLLVKQNELIDNLQENLTKVIEENNLIREEFKAYVNKTNVFIDEVQAKIDKNKSTLIGLAESIDGVINEELNNPTKI